MVRDLMLRGETIGVEVIITVAEEGIGITPGMDVVSWRGRKSTRTMTKEC
jgi:hypothetical protein